MSTVPLKYWGLLAPIPETVPLYGEEVPILLEIQDGDTEIAVAEAAAAYQSPDARNQAASLGLVGRALYAVRGELVTEPPEERRALAGSWPAALTDDLADAYTRARWRMRTERALLDADPDFAPARSNTGESAVPRPSSPTDASPPTSMPSSPTTLNTTNGKPSKTQSGAPRI